MVLYSVHTKINELGFEETTSKANLVLGYIMKDLLKYKKYKKWKLKTKNEIRQQFTVKHLTWNRQTH